MTFVAKPYFISGKIQNYEWGTKNDKAFIPKLLNIKSNESQPFAEYWIGIHPKGPAEIVINNKKNLLSEIIKKYPAEILGERVSKSFNHKLPFLLKILSIDKALSIQLHPNKQMAEILHHKDSYNYPDKNHKPEIAIALDNLKAIVGLKNLKNIRTVLIKYPEIILLLDNELLNKLKEISHDDNELVKEIYNQIMNASKDKLETCIKNIIKRFNKEHSLSAEEKQFIKQYKNYGIDVGLLSILLFNYVELDENEALFTPAGIPHAYIEGNIIECMANSDNVVRAGLTPKFKDINTLNQLLVVESDEQKIDIVKNEDRTIYKTSAREFELSKLKTKFTELNNEEIAILIVLEGKIKITFDTGETEVKKGETILLPAILKNYTIEELTTSKVFMAKVPK